MELIVHFRFSFFTLLERVLVSLESDISKQALDKKKSFVNGLINLNKFTCILEQSTIPGPRNGRERGVVICKRVKR